MTVIAAHCVINVLQETDLKVQEVLQSEGRYVSDNDFFKLMLKVNVQLVHEHEDSGDTFKERRYIAIS